jgi:protein-S-isoprenylcysteine O-methyltransferase Ste14
METENITEQIGNKNIHKNKVHKILAYSYSFYFLFFLFGLLLDFSFPFEIFNKIIMVIVGIIFLIFGTLLIFWAQNSSRKLQKENITKETFYYGPYRYTRSPTHYGLLMLMLGFGIMSNALFIIIFSIISFFVTKFIFLKKEEKILAEKYGAPYLEYKKAVKF